MARLRGLDGLRALAVAAVVAFHLDAPWLPGGFLGVDLFFVLSGFLITRQLLGTQPSGMGLPLRDFYLRRARRILPAAVVVVVACVAAGPLLWRHQGGQLRGDVLAALAFATNWWEIARDASYFTAVGPPSPLRHFWSLAVEEQFYLFWPCVVLLPSWKYAFLRSAFLRSAFLRSAFLRYSVTGALASVGAFASAVSMFVIATTRDIPFNADPSRVYYGTDTHATGLLLGAAAAAFVAAYRVRNRVVEPVPWLTDAAGLGCLAVLVLAMAYADQSSPGLYRGGFLLLSLAALGLVLATGRPGSLPGRILDVAPLRWLGVRSYEIYLWHWPVIALLTALGVAGTARAAVAVPAALALAAATHRYVTRPIWHPDPAAPPAFRPRTLAACAGVVALIAAALPLSSPPPPVTATMPGVSLSDRPGALSGSPGALSGSPGALSGSPGALSGSPGPLPPGLLPSGPGALGPGASGSGASGSGASGSGASGSGASGSGASGSGPSGPGASGPASAAAGPIFKHASWVQGPISAFGDSVMLGAEEAMAASMPRIRSLATVSASPDLIFNRVYEARRRGTLARVVVVHAGDNGLLRPADLDQLLTTLADRALVVLVTNKIPEAYGRRNNAVLATAAARHPNAVVADWARHSRGHDAWFAYDQTHLQPSGAQAFAQLITDAVAIGPR